MKVKALIALLAIQDPEAEIEIHHNYETLLDYEFAPTGSLASRPGWVAIKTRLLTDEEIAAKYPDADA